MPAVSPEGGQIAMDYEARKANLKETRDCLNSRDVYIYGPEEIKEF